MQFRMAANLLEYYRNYHPDLSQVFDLDKTARYWALMDFGNVKHARLYRNHRYYYNPITTKMEMIGFDLHAGADPNENTYAEDVFGKGAKPRGYFLEYHLFNNEEFRERYLFYLKKYSSEEFLSQLEELFLPEMKLAEELIQQEEPDYVFDFDYFRQHATTIRNRLDEINTKWNQYRKEEADSARMISPTEYEKISDDRFIPEISVNAYTYFSEGNIWLQAENFHLAEVRVLGYSLKDDPGMYPLKTDFVLPAYEENNHPVLETKVKFTPEKIFIQPLNDTSQIVEVEVQQWVHPYMSHPRLKLLAEFDTVSKWYDIVGDELVLHGEGGPIDELLYIPAKYEVRIPDSTIIQFQDGGGLIINNDFTAQSGPEHPIIFEDLDGSSNGVTILGPGTVILENVNCINLSPLNFGGWKTNTPFTVFESSCYLGGNFNVSGESADLSVMFIRSEIHPRLLRLSEKSKKLIGGFDVEVKYKRQ